MVQWTLSWLALATTLFNTIQASLQPRPLVLWHGLGDSHSSPGMLEFTSMIKEVHPGIFIHSVYIDQDLKQDREAGFYGKINEQLELVAAQLANISELNGGFDALGFSQGGQFLRAYVQKYNLPPVNNLLTFGSQHMGIEDIPLCARFDVFCQIARRATKRAVYGEWAQNNLIQAQYFRDPTRLPTYLEASQFLADVNNEKPSRNQTYADNLASLNAMILVMFSEDRTVVPKESAWFGSRVIPEEDFSPGHQAPMLQDDKTLVPIHLHPLYQEDWIGLKKLDEKGGLIFDICEGEHMQIGSCWKALVQKWCGGLE
ncbi:palmitoyl-protein thioesterase [Mycena floridula]|nr:palmitoyl-protein thioesterase [Mycena floridula]